MQDSTGIDARIGQVLGGRYTLVDTLGYGGFGAVYLATDALLEREVAIKVLSSSRLGDDAIRRFEREARITGKLRHANIVQVLDFGRDGETLFIVMERLIGYTLSGLLRDHFPLSLPRVVDLLDQLLAALEEAHSLGIVHRDLKPENVFIEVLRDGREQVKVLDFGIARLMVASSPQATREGVLTGTPEYMSPEQCRDQELDGRSDLYAVGCLLYQMLCGRPPFSARAPLDTLVGHLYHEPVPPSRRLSSSAIPPALEGLALWCLAKLPEDRPVNATALRRELELTLKGPIEPGARLRSGALNQNGKTRRRIGLPELEGGASVLDACLMAIGLEADQARTMVEAIRAHGCVVEQSADLPPLADLARFDAVLICRRRPRLADEIAMLTTQNLPVLLCGSEDNLEAMAHAVELGAFDFIPIPINPLALRRSIVRAMRARRRTHA